MVAQNPTLEDARWVMEHAEYVRIDEKAIDRIASEWAKKDFQLPKWDWLVDMSLPPEERFDWFLLGACLNFNFWNKEPDETYKTVWKEREQWGAAGLFASIQRAKENGARILDGDYLANVTEKELEDMFKAEPGHPMPLLKERAEILNAVGKKLVEEYDGKFHNLLKKTGNKVKVAEFAEFLAKEFPEAFNDVAKCKDRQVRFYKKAYLAAAQSWENLMGTGYFEIEDLENSVVFADYVLPAEARHLGMTRYSEELAKEVDNGKIIEPNSKKENEVRTIGAISVYDKLKDRINFYRETEGLPPITGFHIDAAAYLEGIKLAKSGVELNHHRTPTTNY